MIAALEAKEDRSLTGLKHIMATTLACRKKRELSVPYTGGALILSFGPMSTAAATVGSTFVSLVSRYSTGGMI